MSRRLPENTDAAESLTGQQAPTAAFADEAHERESEQGARDEDELCRWCELDPCTCDFYGDGPLDDEWQIAAERWGK